MSVADPLSAPETARDLDALRRRLDTVPEAAELRSLGLGGVLLGPGVLADLAETVATLRRDGGEVVVVSDCRAMARANGELKADVETMLDEAGLTVRRVTVGDPEAQTHADPATLEHAVMESAGLACWSALAPSRWPTSARC